MIITLTDSTVTSFLQDMSKELSILEFWSPSCEPCRLNAHAMEKISKERGDSLDIGKINVEECPLVVGRLQVRVVPSMYLLKRGKVVFTVPGIADADVVVDKIKALSSKSSRKKNLKRVK